ncbi:MAG: glycosyltransferase family 2 protein [Chloroflexi bacterium]|nr:glycosyltransferase family 2 protein [Chloroflexota bacterium]MCC6891380.1 glycosyltransferase family 2 protein [Anaerolineae bacterium]
MGRVYVGIVTYNSAEDLPACFAALAAQTYADVQVVVLDNASVDASVVWVRENAPKTRLILNRENVGFGRAHNQIVTACQLNAGDFYLTLNPDATLMPDYISELVRVMNETGAGWAGGKILHKDENQQPTGILYSAGQGIRRDGYVLNVGEAMPDAPLFNQSREVFVVTGAALMIRAEAIQAIAPNGELFDEQMFLYGEDIDVGWRARRQGWRCWYVPTAVAYHRGGRLNAARRGQALGNTYLSVLKNAYWFDLLTYNLPLILMNLIARTLLSPRIGWALMRQLGRNAVGALRKRQPPKISRAEMLRWYAWTSEQPTTQALGMMARVRGYMSRTRHKAVLGAIHDSR